MIIDTSAIVALLLDEPKSQAIVDALEKADTCRVGAPTLVETTMVMTGKMGDDGRTYLHALVYERNFDVLSFSDAHWHIAQSAFVRYGKGRHSAGLNFGDCLTYAMAYVADEPLLCVGNNFAQTDLELVPLEKQ